VEPRQQRALREVMMKTYVEVMVERLWLDDPAKVIRCTVRWGVYSWSTAQHNPRKKLKKSNHDMQYYVQYLSNKVEQRIRCNPLGCRRRSCRNIQHPKTFKSSSRNNKEWKNIYQIM
jgi:hypothetical protein